MLESIRTTMPSVDTLERLRFYYITLKTLRTTNLMKFDWVELQVMVIDFATFIFIQRSITSLYTVDTVSKAVDIINGNHKKRI